MPDYDPTTVALVSEMLKAVDPQDGDERLSYEEMLRRVQTALMMTLQESDEEPDPEDEQVLRMALGYLDPKNEDQSLGHGEVLRRLLSAIDKELFKWTSGLVQPPGPSGDAQVAVVDTGGRMMHPVSEVVVVRGKALVHQYIWDGELRTCETEYPHRRCHCGYYELQWPINAPSSEASTRLEQSAIPRPGDAQVHVFDREGV